MYGENIQIKHILIKNFGNIAKLDIDFQKLGRGLIAISGPNGSGKTHLLEALLSVPLYRKLVSYDQLVQEHFAGTGEINTTYSVDGTDFNIIIRGKQGKTPECFLNIASECVAGPQTGEFDEAIARYFPPKELVLASRFSPQNDVFGFFSMKKADQHRIFAYLLNLGLYDLYINKNRDSLKRIRELFAQVQGATDDLDTMSSDMDEILEEIHQRNHQLAEFEALLVDAESKRAELQAASMAASVRAGDASGRFTALKTINKSLADALLAKQKRHRDTQKVIEALIKERGMEKAPEIRVPYDEATKLLEQKRLAVKALENSYKDSLTETANLSTELQVASDTLSELWSAVEGAWKELHYQDLSFQAASSRLAGVQSRMDDICDKCPMRVELLQAVEARDVASRSWLNASNGYHHLLLRVNEPAVSETQDRAVRLGEAVANNKKRSEEIYLTITELRKQISSWDGIVQYIQLHEAEKELSTELTALRQRIEMNNAEMTALEPQLELVVEAKNEADHLEERMTLWRKRVTELKVEIAERKARYEVRQGQIPKMRERVDQERQHSLSISDLSLIDTIIQDERRAIIETVCPSIQDTCNLFLANYQNGRFSVELRTTSTNKKGTIEKEDFTPIIHDMLSGTSREKTSPGESAILSEALRMAFAIINTRRSGMVGGVLIRDEVTSAIDVNNVSSYMDILRYSIQKNYFDQIIFVSHLPHVIEQADAVINLSHGRLNEIDA